jgi:hypothetical protein
MRKILSTTATLNVCNGEGGIRTRGRGICPYDGLANRYLQPLGHLSGFFVAIVNKQNRIVAKILFVKTPYFLNFTSNRSVLQEYYTYFSTRMLQQTNVQTLKE